jgi:hypothetical protein
MVQNRNRVAAFTFVLSFSFLHGVHRISSAEGRNAYGTAPKVELDSLDLINLQRLRHHDSRRRPGETGCDESIRSLQTENWTFGL